MEQIPTYVFLLLLLAHVVGWIHYADAELRHIEERSKNNDTEVPIHAVYVVTLKNLLFWPFACYAHIRAKRMK